MGVENTVTVIAQVTVAWMLVATEVGRGWLALPRGFAGELFMGNKKSQG